MPFQYGFRIGLGLGDDVAFGGDDGGCAGVGGADHIASEFHSPRLRLLEVLVHGVGFSVPRHIAGIGKQGGIFCGCNQFVAESVFVTDVEGDFLVFHHQGGLAAAAFAEVGKGHIHHFVKRRGQEGQRFVFSKGDEVVFGVVGDAVLFVFLIAGQVDDGVFVTVAVRSVLADADGERAAVVLRLFGKLRQYVFRQVLAHDGDGGFGQDDDVGSGFADLSVIFLYGRDDLVFTPFDGLGDVALKQGDGAAAAVGAGEVGLLRGMAGGKQGGNQDNRKQAFERAYVPAGGEQEPSAEKGGRQCDHMDAAQWGKAGERAVRGDLGVADCAPAESGQETFAGKLGQRPQNRQRQAGFYAPGQGKFFPQPETECRIEGKVGGEQEGQRYGIEVGQAGNVVQGSVYPVELRRVCGQTEQVGGRGGKTRTQFDEADEGAENQGHQPKVVVGCESEGGGGGKKDEQRPVEGGVLPVFVQFGKHIRLSVRKMPSERLSDGISI